MATTLDLTAVRTRMKATWEAGDYATFATDMEPGAVDLLRAWDVQPGQTSGAPLILAPTCRAAVQASGASAERMLQLATNPGAGAEPQAGESERACPNRSSRGRVNQNVEPLPEPSEVTQMRPP